MGRSPSRERGERMSQWNKEQLENMLEDVVNELGLSESAIGKHGPLGTPPAELVKLVLAEKDRQIKMLKQGFESPTPPDPEGECKMCGSKDIKTRKFCGHCDVIL